MNTTRYTLVLSVMFALSFTPALSQATENAGQMKAKPAAQKKAKKQTKTKGKMEVYGFSHEVVSPRDAASGLPTGKRQHKPVRMSK